MFRAVWRHRVSIQLNGKRLNITTNLYIALRYLRQDDADRIMWVDAVCIDQNNLQERGHQVSQMCNIYSCAERVIFWLGENTSYIDQLSIL
ncbi:HET domain-containing protein [Paraphaeosphaeria sporulosa]